MTLALLIGLATAFSVRPCAARIVFPLHTSGAFIVDANGRRVRLNAVNWYGAESTDFVAGGLNFTTPQSIASQIRKLGFNAVRLPWSNEMVETNPIPGNYALTANPGLQGLSALQIFDQVVSALANEGLMIILDNHNSEAEWCCGDDGNDLWENASYPEASWIADWQSMVQRYANQPWVIGVDLRNEPRVTATWGGSQTTDWHGAAERGGNAVLSVNPNLLIFVEGVNYATDLSGAADLPVDLQVSNQLVYSAHDYGFDYSGLTGYNDWFNSITPRWGYLATGANPQPFWLGEFGTCNTSASCVENVWFTSITEFVKQQAVNWSYWPINGTESTGMTRTFGAPETYGVLNQSWNGQALFNLTAALRELQLPSPPARSELQAKVCPEACSCLELFQ
jgi:endoglucanase